MQCELIPARQGVMKMTKTNVFLEHHGVLGMKWGVRKKYVEEGKTMSSFSKESSKTIKKNKDGSLTVPKGFVFNRVGQSQIDVNKSGALYTSYGKEDAARYVKNLGPTLMGKLLGTAGTTVQHLTVQENLRMASEKQLAEESAKLLLSNTNLRKSFSDSFYSMTATPEGDFSKELTVQDVQKALSDPSGKTGQKLSYSLNSMLGDSNYSDEAKIVYDHMRKAGFDAIPDVHDTLTGTATTSTIVINPDKIKFTEGSPITSETMKEAKDFVKTLEKLKVSELIK